MFIIDNLAKVIQIQVNHKEINIRNTIQFSALKKFFPKVKEELIEKYFSQLISVKEAIELCDECPGIENCSIGGYVPICELEGDILFKTVAPCSKKIQQQKEQRIQKLLQSSRLPEYLRKKNFDNFKVTDDNKEAFKEAKRVSVDSEGKGLVLMGGTGTGKTHLAAAILNTRLNEGKEAIFCTVPELLADIKRTFGNEQETSELIEMVKDTELLLLDDLGAEKATEWVTEQLFVIINARLLRWKQTVITTNFTSNKDLIDRLGGLSGQRIVSRLCEMCVFKKITGEDWRLKL